MAEYGKIYRKFWTNPKNRRLTDDGKLLWLYVLTSPHANMIGFYVLPSSYAQHDLAWTNEKRLDKAFAELTNKGYINRCVDSYTIIIRAWFEHNKIENPNQLKKAEAELSELPLDSTLFYEFDQVIKGLHEGLHKGLVKGYSKPEAETEAESEAENEPESIEAMSILNLWRDVMETPNSKPSPTRLNKIKARLKEGYTKEDIENAIRGCATSKFHMGDNDQKQKHNDLTLICRDGTFVEKFMAMAPQQKKITCTKCGDTGFFGDTFCDQCEKGNAGYEKQFGEKRNG